jgi:hypothetical protein
VARYLRTLPAVRERCERIFRLAERGVLLHFRYAPERMEAATEIVVATIREQYPGLDIPLHSRWRHFEAGGTDRVSNLEAAWGRCDCHERARRKIDLAVLSVLIDAGAGPAWRYREAAGGREWRRSEGLAVASLEMFASGLFSSLREEPWRVDAAALRALETERLAAGLQAGEGNPIAGLPGRSMLLLRLGAALAANPRIFGQARPGGLFDHLLSQAREGRVPMGVLWEALMDGLAPVWPVGRARLGGAALGDVWPHRALSGESPGASLVPFHKLTQWLAYSLLEPLAEAHLVVTDVGELTGLAEYRNGGLFLDTGVLVPCDPALRETSLPQGSEPVVEWRALTVALLDRLAERVRSALGMTPAELPMGRVLQGGTWLAGRRLASVHRPDGAPPLRVESDGMLF